MDDLKPPLMAELPSTYLTSLPAIKSPPPPRPPFRSQTSLLPPQTLPLVFHEETSSWKLG